MTDAANTPRTAHQYLHDEGVWPDEDEAWHERVCENLRYIEAEAAANVAESVTSEPQDLDVEQLTTILHTTSASPEAEGLPSAPTGDYRRDATHPLVAQEDALRDIVRRFLELEVRDTRRGSLPLRADLFAGIAHEARALLVERQPSRTKMRTEQSEAARLHTFHCTGCTEYGGHGDMGARGRQQDPAGPSGAARGVRLPAASTIQRHPCEPDCSCKGRRT